MMRNRILFILLITGQIIAAQQLYIPTNVRPSYENGIRHNDGSPGRAWWQNHAQYKMSATIDTQTDSLKGSGTITYFNDSPDTLKMLVVRFYQDYFRKGNARDWPARLDDLTDGVAVTSLKINGKEADPEKAFRGRSSTNRFLRPEQPLAPGERIQIDISWAFSIPAVRGNRMRKYEDGHYFIAYWYPQIAVYDDVDGWDQIDFKGFVEFYNDFNDYDVSITVPAGHVVWATGELTNGKEVLQPEIFNRYREAIQSDSVVRIITQEDIENNAVTTDKPELTYHFTASGVPDFSFGISDHALWDGAGFTADSATGRRVLTDVVYPPYSPFWDQGAEVARKSVMHLSFNLPAVPYPWPHMTSFCSGPEGGGMETPMMANDGAPNTYPSFAGLIFHEISHSYFPFYSGTNERKYAWMDEGWATYLTWDFGKESDNGNRYFQSLVKSYNRVAGTENDLPLIVPSFHHGVYSSLRLASYTKPAMAYHVLRGILGDDTFRKALQTYVGRWHNKHPLPWDFFNTVEHVAGKNLDWFWQPWFCSYGYPDLALETDNDEVHLVMKGNYPVPAVVKYTGNDGKEYQLDIPASVWEESDIFLLSFPQNTLPEKIWLDTTLVPDINPDNNELILK
ncbi:MAG: M1 family metallopeptidase [Bacteroidales bacterium]